MEALVELCPQNSRPPRPCAGDPVWKEGLCRRNGARASWTGVGPALGTGPSQEEREAETQQRDACGGPVATEAEAGVTQPEPRRSLAGGPRKEAACRHLASRVPAPRPRGNDVASVNRPVRSTSPQRIQETDRSAASPARSRLPLGDCRPAAKTRDPASPAAKTQDPASPAAKTRDSTTSSSLEPAQAPVLLTTSSSPQTRALGPEGKRGSTGPRGELGRVAARAEPGPVEAVLTCGQTPSARETQVPTLAGEAPGARLKQGRRPLGGARPPGTGQGDPGVPRLTKQVNQVPLSH